MFMPHQGILTKQTLFDLFFNLNYFKEISFILLLGKYYIYSQARHKHILSMIKINSLLKNIFKEMY